MNVARYFIDDANCARILQNMLFLKTWVVNFGNFHSQKNTKHRFSMRIYSKTKAIQKKTIQNTFRGNLSIKLALKFFVWLQKSYTRTNTFDKWCICQTYNFHQIAKKSILSSFDEILNAVLLNWTFPPKTEFTLNTQMT